MSKKLVAYFSYSGTTQHLAEKIAELTGSDLLEIKTMKSYSFEYMSVIEEAKHEFKAKARPDLQNIVIDMSEYDTIFLGYPNWCGTCPMAIFTFLEMFDMSSKTIAPFCTHGGSGLGSSENDIKLTCSESTVARGFADGITAEDALKQWIEEVK